LADEGSASSSVAVAFYRVAGRYIEAPAFAVRSISMSGISPVGIRRSRRVHCRTACVNRARPPRKRYLAYGFSTRGVLRGSSGYMGGVDGHVMSSVVGDLSINGYLQVVWPWRWLDILISVTTSGWVVSWRSAGLDDRCWIRCSLEIGQESISILSSICCEEKSMHSMN